MILTPMALRAIHLDMRSDTNAPPKPNTAAKASRAPRLLPRTASQRSSPTRWATIVRTASTARLVTRSRKMRFMAAALGRWADFQAALPSTGLRRGSARADRSVNQNAEGPAHPEGQEPGAAADEDHAQRATQGMPAGEQAEREPHREQGDDGERRRGGQSPV